MSGSSGSGNSSRSPALKGGDWTNTLHFTERAGNPGDLIHVDNKDLVSYFKKIKGTGESILTACIYQNNLSGLPVQVAGGWHEFLVVRAENYFWSFEKNKEGICVQRSKHEINVKDYYRDEERTGTIQEEARGEDDGYEDDTILDIIRWIKTRGFVTAGYHITKSNCQHFASELYKAVTRRGDNCL